MDITTSLAHLWGPAMLAVGVGIFVSREYYVKTYRNLQNETLAVLIFGMAGIALGIAQISVHNLWGTLPEVVVSLLGWALLIKGLTFAVLPRLVDKGGDWAAASGLIPVAGVGTLIIGAYLTWVSYLV